jgi:N-methylhydantoinase A
VQVGLDPRDYVLVGFGGAGPLFLGALLDEVEAHSALVPTHPSVWSAFGGLFADVAHDYARSHIAMLDAVDPAALDRIARDLTALAATDLGRDGLTLADATLGFALDMRYAGQSHEITVPLAGGPPFDQDALADLARDFAALHERHYAHRRDDPCQLVTVRLTARVPRRLALPPAVLPDRPAAPAGRRALWFHGRDAALDAAVWLRESLAAGQRIDGPALIVEPQAHTILPPGQSLEVGKGGELILRRGA